MTQPLGVILAGGRGTRMGHTDKATLILGGQTLLQRAIDRLEPQVAALAINTNTDLPTEFTRLPDSINGHPGPLAGILAALDWAAAMGARHVVTVPVDVPFFPCDLVPRLLHAAEGMAHPLVLAATPRPENERTRSMSRSGLIRHPTFGLWPVALRDDLRAALRDGLRKVVIWTEKHGGREAPFDGPGDPFFNVNTPDDLQQARAMLESAS